MTEQKTGRGLTKTEGEGGTGNWQALRRPWETMLRAAESWKSELEGIEKPWLCWNIDDDWCHLQQKLILETGWTPVVGWDPNYVRRPGRIAPGAVAIDFNKGLDFPLLFPHVPLELAFVWAQRLGFWHSDLLLTRDRMSIASALFDSLQDGEMAAVHSIGGLRNLLNYRQHRYWEVLGCVTRGASLDQYNKGCGWWRQWAKHINAPTDAAETRRRAAYYNDHGSGVMYWKRHCQGKVRDIRESFVKEGHFSVTSKANYIKTEDKVDEMRVNFDLRAIANGFGIDDLLG